MKVLKFGGTSIGSVSAIRKVIQIIQKSRQEKIVLVFSAFGKTTDRLIEMAESAVSGQAEESYAILRKTQEYHLDLMQAFLPPGEDRNKLAAQVSGYFANLKQMLTGLAALRDFSPPVRDEFLAHGELLSTTILSTVFRWISLPAVWLDARKIVATDSRFNAAEPKIDRIGQQVEQLLLPELNREAIPVLAGFIGSNRKGRTTTLGRGGSDYTAALLGAILQAQEVQIWTDVDGIMTADPSLVADARSIPVLSFREAAELAYFGARVLHPKTLIPAMEQQIPVRVLNTHRPDGKGTLILPELPPNGQPVRSIAYKEGMTLITIVSSKMFKSYGFLKKITEVFERYQIAIDLIASSIVSVAIALHENVHIKQVIRELQSFGSVGIVEKQAVVCVVGEQIRQKSGIAEQIFAAVHDVPVSMISQGGSEISISFICDEKHLPRVVPELHRTFFSASKSDRMQSHLTYPESVIAGMQP